MAFSPPNDFVAAPSSHSWATIALGAGGGCLTVVTLLTLLATYGTCTATEGCCDTIEATSRHLVEPAQRFVDRVGEGDLEGAYAQMSPEYRAASSLEDMTQDLSKSNDLFRGGQVQFLRVANRTRDPARGAPKTVVWVQIVDRKTQTQKGTATFVYRRDASGDFVIDRVLVGDGQSELAATEVEDVLNDHATALGEQDLTAARLLHSDRYRADTSPASYREFIKAQGSLFVDGRLKIIDVTVEGQTARARAQLMGPDGTAKLATLDYELRRDRLGLWRIETLQIHIETQVSASPDGKIKL